MSRLFACLLLLLAACDRCGNTTLVEVPPVPDGGASVDAGVIPDAGEEADAGEIADAGESTDAGSAPDAGGPAHVEIRDGALRIDGRPTYLFGGDLHYFRVRAANFDQAATWAMWEHALDLMHQAGMNLVTTYIPWDYHSPSPGQWDFTGARDVGHFLQLACSRGFHVVAKPGPLITGEWPRGFGTFGAVPDWFKQAHPEALAQKADGSLYSYSPTGDTSQRQPSYLHPAYLAEVRRWYHQVAEILRPFENGCLVAVQVDNETNLYWGKHFGDVDYAPTALAHYRAWLAAKYGSIAQLNQQYATSYTSFDEVQPPTAPPSGSSRVPNPWLADWYWAGQALVADYLKTLQGMLDSEGLAPPALVHLTNDSPFALLAGDVVLQHVLLHDGPTKDPIAPSGLDLYPKQDPTNDHLQDQPFQADYFTRSYAQSAGRDFAWAAELQGGFYAFPLLGRPHVRPEATDQLLARTVGRGLKGGSVYVVQDGLNLDGSGYDYDAPITRDGRTTARFDVLSRWGHFLAANEAPLLAAHEVTNDVLVLSNGLHAAPQAGFLDELQRLHTVEEPALFGWLAHAGIDPEVADARLVTSTDLARFKVVFYQNPDAVDDRTATLLADYVAQGGVLVSLLWPARTGFDGRATAATTRLSGLFPVQDAGFWAWPNGAREGQINLQPASGAGGIGPSYWYESFWTPLPNAPLVALARERTAPFGMDGRLVGFTVRDGQGTRALLGTNVWARFGQDDYYALDPAQLAQGQQLARALAALGGEQPILTTGAVRQLAWARRAGERLYLFVVNDGAQDAAVHLTFAQPDRLGILAARQYLLTEALGGVALPARTGAQLAGEGLDVPVRALSTAVVAIDPSTR